MKPIALASLAALAGIVLLLAACNSDGADAPAATATLESASTPVAGLDGGTLFAQSCSTCHGVDLRGTDLGPPLLDRIYAPGHHSDAAFRLAVQQGVTAHHWRFGNMPKIEGLTDEQVGAIIEFVRAQQLEAGVH